MRKLDKTVGWIHNHSSMTKQRIAIYLRNLQSRHMVAPVSVNIKNIGSISFPIALVALSGWLVFLGVVYHDDWAKEMFRWVVGIAIFLHIFWRIW
jgi:hypothetical protein